MNGTVRIVAKYAYIFLTLWCALFCSRSGVAQENPLQFEYHLEKAKISAGEPVLIDLELRNHGPKSVDVDLGGDGYDNFIIRSVDPSGNRNTRPPIDGRNRIIFSGMVHLEPGQSFKEILVLNQWFSFTKLGAYTIELGLRNSSAPRTNLYLDVGPKDESALKHTCSELLSRIKTTTSAQESIVATQALSFIDDSAAVSAWAGLLSRPDLGDKAIAALVKIGNSDSASALIANLATADSQSRASLSAGLQMIASKTTDQELKQRIRAALAER